ncbi:hypothetical protein GQ600_21266 [Phytophthora cactorum]|nr:hypothetical protein GQ600_21266 [Phytophthora cactorum]
MIPNLFKPNTRYDAVFQRFHTCSTLWSKLKHKTTSRWYLSRKRPSTRRMFFWRCSRRLDNCYVLFMWWWGLTVNQDGCRRVHKSTKHS